MSDLIRRSDVSDLVLKYSENEDIAEGWNGAIDAVLSLPAVDAVEVVRCRECHWFSSGENVADVWDWCILRKCDTDPHGYCHLAIEEDGDT